MSWLLGVLGFIFTRGVSLGVLVFVHEMGHYLAARWRGIYVEAFSIGFGPALLSWTDRAGTVWKLSALPLGGYVRMHGMAINVADEAQIERLPGREGQAFFEKSVLSRSIAVAAGPAANFLLAAVLFTGLYLALGRQVPLPVVGEISPGSSAEIAGLKVGDEIRAVDGRPVADFETLRRIVAGSAGHTLNLAVHRGAADLTIPVAIKPVTAGDMSVGRLGVTSGQVRSERMGPLAALWAGLAHTGDVMWQTLSGLGHIIFTGQGVHDLAGPIGVIVLSGQVAKLGLATTISFVAFLSINLGLVNLLPIPVLDGGHLMFYAAEALRGRPLPPRALDYGYRIGFAFIASFFVFVSWNDLVHTGAVRWVTHLIG